MPPELKSTSNNFSPAVIACYLIVGILWGCTNPFIKHAQASGKHLSNPTTTESKSYSQVLQRFFTEPALFLPFLINQSGSLFYYYIISRQPISLASPVCNSLSFIFTAVTSYWYFKEELHSLPMLLVGIIFVLLGSYVCILS